MKHSVLTKYLISSLIKLSYMGMIIMIFAFSCKSPAPKQPVTDTADHKEGLIRNQQNIVRDESTDIESYIERRNYKMSATATGLRYMIYEHGAKKKSIIDDSKVRLTYSVSLLDGSEVYSSDSTGALDLVVGKSEVASGLQEGLKLMHEGDKAIFIVPSHLAYGLTGDGDKIKQYQVLVIDVHLLKVFD